MDTLPPKPPSSKGRCDRDRDRTKDKDESCRRSRHHDRDGDRKGDKDRDRNRRHRHHCRRSASPTEPASKRPRSSGASHKGKEPMRDGDVEPGMTLFRVGVSNTEVSLEKPRSEQARQNEKGTEREWDVGKLQRMGREDGRGTKRKYDDVSDGEDDRAYRRRERFESRKAPWVSQVDWDSCHRNVAEMYVLRCRRCPGRHLKDVGYIAKWRLSSSTCHPLRLKTKFVAL